MNCPHCQAAVTTDPETTEQVSDDVRGLKCPACGTQIYVFAFSFRIDSTSAPDIKSEILHCDKCDINTSGIPSDDDPKNRHCPICRFLFPKT